MKLLPCRLLKPNKMRTFITIALLIPVAFAATVNKECKQNCMKDCKKVANEAVAGAGTNCTMFFGTGPKGQGWYSFHDDGNDQVGTCKESCRATCKLLCARKDARYGWYGR